MDTQILSTLTIHQLTRAQYEREKEAGRIDETALYLTTDEEVDLSQYVTVEQLNGKANAEHNHDDKYYTESEIDEQITGLRTAISESTNTAKSYSDANLEAAKLYADEVTAQKSKVQVVTSDETRHLPILTIHRLTQEEYDNLVENGEIDENAIYLTPDEEQPSIDLSGYATIEQLDAKADAEHNHDEQYYAKSEVDEMLIKKVEISSLSDYYTKSEIDDYEFITIEDIDNICKTTINIQMVGGNEVKF